MVWSEQRISRQLKLRDLHVLMTVARCGSMGKAANQLSVSQPAISKAVADMEAALGVKLLDRNPRGVVPTIYARALLDRGLVAFDELKQGIEQVDFLADPATGELRIGSTIAIATPPRRRRPPVTEISARGLSPVGRGGGDDVPHPGRAHG